jgi:hypothetical protein
MKVFMILIAVIGMLVLVSICQPKSRKMFIKNILKQIPYLIPRYFA